MNIDETIASIKTNQNVINTYASGIELIKRSGILDVIRAMGQPVLYNRGSDVNMSAAEAARAVGFNQALYNIEHFVELHLKQTLTPTSQRMDFNGVERAVASGNLTKEEADAIRNGKPVEYDISKFTNQPVTTKHRPA